MSVTISDVKEALSTPKGAALAGVVLISSWTVAKGSYALIHRLIYPDPTPEYGSRFTIRDIVQDVGLDNETRRALEKGYYEVSLATPLCPGEYPTYLPPFPK